jgi:hypothetical protein
MPEGMLGRIRARLEFLFAEQRPLSQRLVLALLVSTAFSFTVVLFGCISQYYHHHDRFIFRFADALGPIVLLFCLMSVVLAGLLLLTRGRFFDILVSLLAGLLLVLFAQAHVLGFEIVPNREGIVIWDDYRRSMLANTMICLLIFPVPLVLRLLGRGLWRGCVTAASLLLIIVQAGFGFMYIQSIQEVDAVKDDGTYAYLSNEGIYDVSSDENIIVIIIDSFDQRFIDRLNAEEPGFLAGRFDGFTCFTNNTSIYDYTYPSIVNMLTGKRYLFEYPGGEFMTNSWRSGTFLPTLREQGDFTSKIYTGIFYAYNDGFDLENCADNIEVVTPEPSWRTRLLLLFRASVFEHVPLVFKPMFWLNKDALEEHRYVDGEYGEYVSIDERFYRELREKRLEPTQDGKNFAFYHLGGSHAPYYLNEYVKDMGVGSNVQIQTKASFRIVFEYLDQLRELELYKDATIIVTGDHGYPLDGREFGQNHEMYWPVLTALYVKPSGSEGTPLAYSSAPVNHDNLRATIIDAAGLDSSEFGQTYFEVAEDSDVVRDYYYGTVRTTEGPAYLEIFEITGDASDFDNWHETARVPKAYWY